MFSRLLPEIFAKYVRKERHELVMFHRVPSCLAGTKKHATLFEAHWNKLVSPGQVMYAHSDEGKEAIAFAQSAGLFSSPLQRLKDVYI